MSENFLNYLLYENSGETLDDLLTYINWSDEDKRQNKYPSVLNFNADDLKLFDNSKPANDILSKLYFEDNELLFFIIFSQRIIYLSVLEEVFTYNFDLEDPSFEYDEKIHEHIYLTDVNIFMIRTLNKIFIFGNSGDSNYNFEQVVIHSNGHNLNSSLANKTFERLGIENDRSFQTLINIVENHFKPKK
jgi:hypothetical protein